MSADGVQELFAQLEGHIKDEAHDDVLQVPSAPPLSTWGQTCERAIPPPVL